eukprot:TRINITY_DN145_c0_g7_i1.p1 TRINITY_DN145_c0_g7~~TRINITY_DN145_c0_g7_i1.p1  ORF type:complete len:360 (-),score=213.82 TRINITY_DN145_c0_g7_i1:108-1187(-)
MTSSLLTSGLKIGRYTLRNRLIMSPMTRNRGLVPSDLQALYYGQRASAGLIISEGTFIEQQGSEWPDVPGIYTTEQVNGWKKVTNAVHQRGGLIFCQIWHVGRLTHPEMALSEGKQPFGPSAIQAAGGKIPTPTGIKGYVLPRELTVDEIQALIGKYADAASRAIEAGFDGVELHGAYGYLIDQFLQSASNQRTDQYGGSIQNRARFLFELVERVIAAVGSDRLGLKLSPSNTYNGMKDDDNLALFSYIVTELNKYNLAYLYIMEGTEMDAKHGGNVIPGKIFRPLWKGTLLLNCGYTPQTGAAAVTEGNADGIIFGRAFLANPDLVERVTRGAELNQPRYEFLYQGGEQGYTDYPTLA